MEAFKGAAKGNVELITSAATHGFTAFGDTEGGDIRPDRRRDRSIYQKIFGNTPRGIWLPNAVTRVDWKTS